jgi:hypothetical protein
MIWQRVLPHPLEQMRRDDSLEAAKTRWRDFRQWLQQGAGKSCLRPLGRAPIPASGPNRQFAATQYHACY